MMGRKSLPDAIKAAKGTLRPCRVNKSSPKFERISSTSAPDYLTPVAAAEFKEKADLLKQMGVMTQADNTALAAYASAYGRWREAQEILANEGVVITTEAGNTIQHPACGIAARALDQMFKFLAEFGLTPASRSKVSVSSEDGSEWNVFEKVQ